MPTQLHSYQSRALEELHNGKRAIFYSYGTGKSRIALDYSLYLNSHVVIFCKLRNVATWQRELHKWYPEISTDDITAVQGNKKDRVALFECFDQQPRILIIPYSIVLRDKEYLSYYLDKLPPERIIADESTTIKNPAAGVTKVLLKIRERLPDYTQCILLTGNPIPEHPKEIWSQLTFAYGEEWTNVAGKTFYRFMKEWFVYGQYGATLNIAKEEQYTKLLDQYGIWLYDTEIKNMRDEAGFPTPKYIIEEFELRKPQKDALAELFDDWAITHQDETEEYNYIITLQMKAQQICSGFFIQQDGSAAFPVQHDKNNKLIALYDVVRQLLEERASRKIIVWRKFVVETQLIERQLQEFGCVIGPDEETLTAFMEDPSVHIIIMPVDCSQGFNELAVADVGIFFSNSYSVDSRTQAEARIERQGQKASRVTHIDLCTNVGRDREIVTMLQAKDFSPLRLKATIVKDRTRFWKQGSTAWYTTGDNDNGR